MPAFRAEVLQDFKAASTRCVAGADMLLEELAHLDPDPDERCGLLDGRHELYAIPVPGCRRLVLAVSLDTGRPDPWPCTVHGLLGRTGTPCAQARKRAERHLNLVDPIWEPADAQE